MSLEKITELLHKQKVVEGMVHGQHMHRQNLVETILRKQHMSEARQVLEKQPAGEIANLLESLPLDEAKLVWRQIPAERENDVLWELSDSFREILTDGKEPQQLASTQINAFVFEDERLKQIQITHRKDLENIQPIWVDMLCATRAELKYVGHHFGVELPDTVDVTDLEVSSRFHAERAGEISLHSNFLLDREGNSRSVPVVFIQHKGILFSIRNAELPVFRLQRRRARSERGYVRDCQDILLDLYGADVEYSADSLEDIYQTLGKVGRSVLGERVSDEEASGILGEIAEEEDLNGRIRSNILDTQRAISFLMRCKVLSPSQLEDANQILRDIDTLNSHTSFLFDKINFLMDATIGFININQNKRVNQLTMFGVVFMPINILAGIGGMSEFSMMTDGIPWPLAYGSFLASMAAIGWGTYVLVKQLEKTQIAQHIKSISASFTKRQQRATTLLILQTHNGKRIT